METTLSELASKPAGQDQIDRAYILVGNDPALKMRVDEFIASRPLRGEMLDFLEQIKEMKYHAKLNEGVRKICASLGIEQPTGTEKLLALQAMLLQEQNTVLQSTGARALNQMRADAKAKDDGSGISIADGLVAGSFIGLLLANR